MWVPSAIWALLESVGAIANGKTPCSSTRTERNNNRGKIKRRKSESQAVKKKKKKKKSKRRKVPPQKYQTTLPKRSHESWNGKEDFTMS
jgi:hypothetical protein